MRIIFGCDNSRAEKRIDWERQQQRKRQHRERKQRHRERKQLLSLARKAKQARYEAVFDYQV